MVRAFPKTRISTKSFKNYIVKYESDVGFKTITVYESSLSLAKIAVLLTAKDFKSWKRK